MRRRSHGFRVLARLPLVAALVIALGLVPARPFQADMGVGRAYAGDPGAEHPRMVVGTGWGQEPATPSPVVDVPEIGAPVVSAAPERVVVQSPAPARSAPATPRPTPAPTPAPPPPPPPTPTPTPAPSGGCTGTDTQPPPCAPPSVSTVESIIVAAAQRHGVDPNWMLRIADCESGDNAYAINRSGPYDGLFQFRPSTFYAHGGSNIWDASQQSDITAAMLANGQAWQWSCA